MVSGERRRSFGIGGAGNIRTQEEAIVHDLNSPSDATKRRRSSLWSVGSSSDASGESRSSKLPGRFKSMFGNGRTKSIPEDTK
ncbi:hypothetical protein F4819DRAFT_489606 [Hypoxylon fuscum]|nr:hypothetical protein F4819DRAFT_489606 [Hypoxylon fuscum]